MPSLSAHQSGTTTKALVIGDSGTGKTGALASLVFAGYKLRIADFDNGLDVLANIVRAKDPKLLENVSFETLTDPVRLINGQQIPQAKSWTRLQQLLEKWPDGIGSITTWGTDDIFVLDSLSFAGKAAIRFVQGLNGRSADIPGWNDYYTAQQLVERLLATLYSDSIKCNVIVLSHVREIAKERNEVDSKGRPIKIEEQGTRKGYAETGTGRALSPTTGRYFNAILLADIVGSGASARRIIRTVPHDNIGLKNPAPGIVKPEYPLATGLADYFKAVRATTTESTPT